jgi:hypothetical protein
MDKATPNKTADNVPGVRGLGAVEKAESNINSNKTNDMKNNEVPEGESDNPKGDPDDETSGEDTLETDGGGESLEGTSDPSKE